MKVKVIKTIALLTLFCTVFVCAGTFCSEAASKASKPGQVKSFQVKVSGRNVKLSWSKAKGRVSRYVIYRNGKKLATVSRKTLKYTDKDRKYGNTYSYKVRAYRKKKGSRIYGKWSVSRKAVIKPGQVSGLKCTGKSSNQVSLSWKKAPGATGYAVYRGDKLVARTKNTSYTDKGLLPGSEYKYYIKSYVKNGSKYVYGKSSKTLKAATTTPSPAEDPPTLVDIYCAQTAIDRVGPEDLEFFIDVVRNKLQPQAVGLILTKFPGMNEAAEQGCIGNNLPLYIYYISGDKDGCMLHEKAEPSALKIMDAVERGGETFFAYLLAVDISPLCKGEKDGFMLIYREGEPMELLKNRLTGEMLRTFMFDFDRSGMIGARNTEDAVRDDEGGFPTEEKYELYRKTVFPKWFTEGTVASVENVYKYEKDQFMLLKGGGNNDLLNNYVSEDNGFDLESNVLTYDSEESCRVSGYLAVLYLSELMAAKENESSIDENGSVSADRLCHGLDRILTRMHTRETLDEVINYISPCDSDGVKLYKDTEDFEKQFIKGRNDGDGQYTGDQASMDFVNALLEYLESAEGSSGQELPGGSILTDLKQSSSPLDEGRDCSSDYLRIIESKEPIESTVPDSVAHASGGRSR